MGGELARELGRDLEQDGVVKEDQGGGVSDCGLVAAMTSGVGQGGFGEREQGHCTRVTVCGGKPKGRDCIALVKIALLLGIDRCCAHSVRCISSERSQNTCHIRRLLRVSL